MIRRNFITAIPFLGGITFLNGSASAAPVPASAAVDDRKYWIDTLVKIASPVMVALSEHKLKERMPIEVNGSKEERSKVTYLEAFGRAMAGLAPWLQLEGTTGTEASLQKKYRDLAAKCVDHAVDPSSPSFMNFTEGRQPLVDAAFFAHALLRAPGLWPHLGAKTQANVVKALKSTRVIKPYYSNWLLFTAMVEAALLKFTGEYDAVRIDYAIKQHMTWYKGDGVYGDGPDFHFDYYNSFVIQPMMLDVLSTLDEKAEKQELLETVRRRAQRYAEIQERLISPDGTFPPIGRSLAYRCGAFQHLAQAALQKNLPPSLKAGQVRSALTAVIRTTMDAPQTFDDNGWLTLGFAGHQPAVGEGYISTGSLYLCTTAFLPLGLPASDEFWTSPSQEWTSVKAFSGKPFPIDKALSS
jgi:hypothetical protein